MFPALLELVPVPVVAALPVFIHAYPLHTPRTTVSAKLDIRTLTFAVVALLGGALLPSGPGSKVPFVLKRVVVSAGFSPGARFHLNGGLLVSQSIRGQDIAQRHPTTVDQKNLHLTEQPVIIAAVHHILGEQGCTVIPRDLHF